MWVWELYTQLFARNWRCGRFAQSLSQGCSEKIRKKDVVMTAGRWSSWSIQIPQFLMFWWLAIKAGSIAETKRQSSQWKHAGSPKLKKARQSKSTHKLLMIPFFDSTCMIYMHWVPPGQTVNKEYYVLRKFRKRFRQKRPALFKLGQWHFHQDNASVHNSIVVTDYLTKMGIKTVPHPPYSPDLAPCDFWLFPKLKEKLVVMRQLRRWKRLGRRSLTCLHKRTSRSYWNGTTSALQPEEITSKGTRVSCVYYQ